MPDYIPPSDGDYLAWLQNFVTYITANSVILGLIPAQVTAITNQFNLFEAAYEANNTAQNAAQATAQAKDDQRAASETVVRSQVAQFQENPAITDPQRESMSITVRDTTKTPSSVPTTRPTATIDTSQRFTHVISFRDEATPDNRKKPDGVAHCEIWVKIGGPVPVGPNECSFLAADTVTPYTATYDGADGGKLAHYMLRWVNTRGQQGPWSATVTATIAA